jgi:hypothetical protein
MYESIKELGIIGFLGLSIMWYSKEYNILETGSISQTLCCVDYWAMDNIQTPSDPKCYTPPSDMCKM